MIRLCPEGSFERAMIETPEEKAYFAEVLAGENEWRAEELMRVAAWREELASNLAAQAFAPEGRYAYLFNEWGMEVLSPHATEIFDEDNQYISKVRVRAATRKL